eukprot:8752224-Pyramimonas_sp.AAC.1
MRSRGQHATTIEVRSGILRRLLRVMEAEFNRFDIPVVFARLLREAVLPPVVSPSIARYLHAARCSAVNQLCYPTCPFWTTNSRRRHPTVLENRPSA